MFATLDYDTSGEVLCPATPPNVAEMSPPTQETPLSPCETPPSALPSTSKEIQWYVCRSYSYLHMIISAYADYFL
jgi:hypothetical protein